MPYVSSHARRHGSTLVLQAPPGSIDEFSQLSSQFSLHLNLRAKKGKTVDHLQSILQGENEDLASYMKRFDQAYLETEGVEHKESVQLFISGMLHKECRYELSKQKPKTLKEAYDKAEIFAQTDRLMKLHIRNTRALSPKRNESSNSSRIEPT